MADHKHSNFTCPAHVPDCSCLNFKEWVCNPYWVTGSCPDDLDVEPAWDPVKREWRE